MEMQQILEAYNELTKRVNRLHQEILRERRQLRELAADLDKLHDEVRGQ